MLKLSDLDSNTAATVRKVVLETTNQMGTSSTIHVSGAVDSYDPKLKKQPLRRFRDAVQLAKPGTASSKKVKLGSKSPVIIHPTMKDTQTSTNDDSVFKFGRKNEELFAERQSLFHSWLKQSLR